MEDKIRVLLTEEEVNKKIKKIGGNRIYHGRQNSCIINRRRSR